MHPLTPLIVVWFASVMPSRRRCSDLPQWEVAPSRGAPLHHLFGCFALVGVCERNLGIKTLASRGSDAVSGFGLKDKRIRSPWKPLTGFDPVHVSSGFGALGNRLPDLNPSADLTPSDRRIRSMHATVPASQVPPTRPCRVAAARLSFSPPWARISAQPWAVRAAAPARVGLRPWARISAQPWAVRAAAQTRVGLRPWAARAAARPWGPRNAAVGPSSRDWELRVVRSARLGDPTAVGRADRRSAGRAWVGPVLARPGGGSLAGARAASGRGVARAGGCPRRGAGRAARSSLGAVGGGGGASRPRCSGGPPWERWAAGAATGDLAICTVRGAVKGAFAGRVRAAWTSCRTRCSFHCRTCTACRESSRRRPSFSRSNRTGACGFDASCAIGRASTSWRHR